MKKIISFSLWGSNAGYCSGAVDNARRAALVYPGWTCRFYCDSMVPKRYIDELLSFGSEIVMKPASDDFMGLYWRFEPMYDDGDVERFIVRDTDSRVNAREADAVLEWEQTGLPFHVMRDNNEHRVKIMGGMWGAKAGSIPEFSQLMQSWLRSLEPDYDNPRGKYHGTDQIFLESMIWPYFEQCHIGHILHEGLRRSPFDRQFKVSLNREGYVGMIYSPADEDRTQLCSTTASI
jgi:hypothetical protein